MEAVPAVVAALSGAFMVWLSETVGRVFKNSAFASAQPEPTITATPCCSSPAPPRSTLLLERLLPFLRVFRQREEGDLAFGEGHRLLEGHRFDAHHGVHAAADRSGRLVGDASEQPVQLCFF